MAVSRSEIRDHHAAPQLEGRDDGVRIAQPILPGASGVQPPTNRSWQTVEDHASGTVGLDVMVNEDCVAVRVDEREWRRGSAA